MRGYGILAREGFPFNMAATVSREDIFTSFQREEGAEKYAPAVIKIPLFTPSHSLPRRKGGPVSLNYVILVTRLSLKRERDHEGALALSTVTSCFMTEGTVALRKYQRIVLPRSSQCGGTFSNRTDGSCRPTTLTQGLTPPNLAQSFTIYLSQLSYEKGREWNLTQREK